MKCLRILEPEPDIRILELNRPDKRNALSVDLLAQLADAVASCDPSRGQRVVILRGAGPVFCAGLDLEEARDPAHADHSAEQIARALKAIAESRSVTIASIHGAAIAGGAGLMSACDFALAARGTKIGYPGVHRGLVAGVVMTFLRRQLRERDVRELFLLGEIIDADRAAQIGLVNRVLDPSELEAHTQGLARRVLAGAPSAVALTKQLIGEFWPRTIQQDLDLARQHHLDACNSSESAEGFRAFFEKRPPKWNP